MKTPSIGTWKYPQSCPLMRLVLHLKTILLVSTGLGITFYTFFPSRELETLFWIETIFFLPDESERIEVKRTSCDVSGVSDTSLTFLSDGLASLADTSFDRFSDDGYTFYFSISSSIITLVEVYNIFLS